MEMIKITASDIGRRITISYPDSGTDDQIVGELVSVSHGARGNPARSEIVVKVAGLTYEFHNQDAGRWREKLELGPKA